MSFLILTEAEFTINVGLIATNFREAVLFFFQIPLRPQHKNENMLDSWQENHPPET